MKSLALAALVAGAAVGPAAAQTWYDPATLLHNSYVEVEGGAAFQGRMESHIAAQGLGSLQQSASQNQKFFGGALVGYRLVDGLSIEAEGIYSRNNTIFASANPVFGDGGATRTYGGMGNLRFSLPFTPKVMNFGIKPYVAAGVGYGQVQLTGASGIYNYRDEANGLLWQGKAGIEIQATQHIALDIGYRYVQSPDYSPKNGAFGSPNYSVLARSHIQAATAGLKFYF